MSRSLLDWSWVLAGVMFSPAGMALVGLSYDLGLFRWQLAVWGLAPLFDASFLEKLVLVMRPLLLP